MSELLNIEANGWKLMDEYGVWVKVDEQDGSLLGSPQQSVPSKNTLAMVEHETVLVTAPVNQKFLDKVNSLFLTTYKMVDFDGR